MPMGVARGKIPSRFAAASQQFLTLLHSTVATEFEKPPLENLYCGAKIHQHLPAVMKRRNAVLDGKPRRPVKRPTTSSKIGENFYGSSSLVYIKLLVLWGLVILADYFLEFRFEYLWPFWLFLRSVYDSFKYQGLAFSVFFICIAVTSDMICFLFIPVHWLFFAASTYVWVQYVWHTEKGFCVPTVFLWLLFVYIEASIRLKELKASLDLKHLPFHLDLCRPFAAHCIGYPVVTLGFGFKSYVGFRMRLRRQKEVQKENEYYYEFLREALPPGPIRDEAFNVNPQPSPKACSEDRISGEAAHANGSAMIPTSGSACATSILSSSTLSNLDSLTSSAAASLSLPSSCSSLLSPGATSEGLTDSSLLQNGCSASLMANGKNHHHNGDLLNPKLVLNGNLNNNAAQAGAAGTPGELDYMEKMKAEDPDFETPPSSSGTEKKRSAKMNGGSQPRDASRKGRSSTATCQKDEIITKMESDMKKLKVDLQLSRNKENDLRDQIVSYMTGERTLKSEISNLQVEKSLLESRVNALMSTRAGEKATLNSLERKLAEERKQKTEFQIKLETERKVKKEAATAEKTAQQNQTRSEVAKLEAEIKTLRSELERARDRCEGAEREVYQLKSYREIHGDPEVLVNALKGVQEKNRQLELKLSEETKVKMDLFSALGETKREISIKEHELAKKDKELKAMSGRMTEMVALGGSSVTSLAGYGGAGGATGASNGGALSLDLPAATDLSSFNTGKLTAGLGLSNLEEKLGSLFSSPSLGSGFSKANGNSNLD